MGQGRLVHCTIYDCIYCTEGNSAGCFMGMEKTSERVVSAPVAGRGGGGVLCERCFVVGARLDWPMGMTPGWGLSVQSTFSTVPWSYVRLSLCIDTNAYMSQVSQMVLISLSAEL